MIMKIRITSPIKFNIQISSNAVLIQMTTGQHSLQKLVTKDHDFKHIVQRESPN